MPNNSKAKIRVSLDLSQAFHDRLGKLEELVQADSKAEVIRDALEVAEFIATSIKQGYTFVKVDPSGKQESVLFYTLLHTENYNRLEPAHSS